MNEKLHDFDTAVKLLQQGSWIDYEVSVGSHTGALMTRENWLESVESGIFVDYDGYGSQLTKDGEFIGGYCRPSAAVELLADTVYILWYNR